MARRQNAEAIGIDLKGRVNSMKLAESNMLIPLFETIVNSIHAIEDAQFQSGRISVIINREATLAFEDSEGGIPYVNGFTIIDNGIGFDEVNYGSFKRAYSTHKAKRGGKGIGRFMWLKAFNDVRVESVFKDEGQLKKRSFRFNLKSDSGIQKPQLADAVEDTRQETQVVLTGFKDPYKLKCPKRPETIANRIIEHCLIYFLNPDCPHIELKDGATTINLNKQFAHLTTGNIYEEFFKVGKEDFKLTLLKWFEHDELTYHKIALCADHREVEAFNINKVFQDINGKIEDEATGKQYLIVGYVEGKYLNQHTNDERTEIEFSKDGLHDRNLIGRQELYKAIEPVIKKHFAVVVNDFKQKKLATLNNFIADVAPQYRILSSHRNVLETIVVTENMTEQDIDLKLYKAYQDIDFESRKEVNLILKNIAETDNPDALRDKYVEVVHNLSELNKSKLAQYVVHRKYIIDLFEKSLELNDLGKYDLEKTVHDIIFPTKKGSDEVLYEDQNLWLIDERLSFHTFLASDKPLNSAEGLETESTERPDLFIHNNPVFDNPISFAGQEDGPFNSVILIEFKRPMRNAYDVDDENPIIQLYNYVKKIRAGKQLMKNGRRYPINDNTWFYLYLICDPHEKLDDFATYANLERTHDGLGYHGYNKNLKCMVEVMTFDQVKENAKKRNRILFHKLGI